MGSEGLYSHTFVYERKDDCPVCAASTRKVTLSPTTTLNELIQQLKDGDLRLQAPNMTTSNQTLYMQKPPALEKATRPNLDKALSVLLGHNGGLVTVTDPILHSINLSIDVTFQDPCNQTN